MKLPSVEELIRKHSKARYLFTNRYAIPMSGQSAVDLMVAKYAK